MHKSKNRGTLVLKVLGICCIVIAILIRPSKTIIERPSNEITQKDIILYEKELFAIGYASRALEENPYMSKSKYMECKRRGYELWDASTVPQKEQNKTSQ